MIDTTSIAQGRPLLLHFAAAEVARLIGARVESATVERAVRVILLSTATTTYIPISTLWENEELTPPTLTFIELLVSSGRIDTVGYHGSGAAFLETHRRLYAHEAERYGRYFDGTQLATLRKIPVTVDKNSDTTAQLEVALLGAPFLGAQDLHPAAARLLIAIDAVVVDALSRRDGEALTYSYLRPYIEASDLPKAQAEEVLRRRIYFAYTSHYASVLDARIPTGFPASDLLDEHLPHEFALSDLVILKWLLIRLGLGSLVLNPWDESAVQWTEYLHFFLTDHHQRVAGLIRTLLVGAQSAIPFDYRSSPPATRRALIASEIRRHLDATQDLGLSTGLRPKYELAAVNLRGAIGRLEAANPGLRQVLREARLLLVDRHTDVLLMTATPLETRAVIKAFGLSDPTRLYTERKTYFDLGTHGGARVMLVETEMSSRGPSGSTLTTDQALRDVEPNVVVLVGVAFGVSERKQKLGDLLVPSQLQDYELQRVGEPVVLRGPRVPVPDVPLDRFRGALPTWSGPEVHRGLLLTGDKLIDDKSYREDLVRLCGGEAIGGEMEGAGLWAAAQRHGCHWALVKGICDWGDGNKNVKKSARQELAASNAAEFVKYCIDLGGFVPGGGLG